MSVLEAISATASGGSRLRLRVQPGARRAAVELDEQGGLKIRLQAPAVEGAANRALVETLAKTLLGLPRSGVRLISGDKSRDKVVEVDLPPEELDRRLRAAIG
jgi:uncharacterized protein (TIGR00251 family)